MKCTRRFGSCTLALAIAATLASVPRRADATFPGKNGGVAFRLFGAGNANAIHLGSLQLTNPDFPAYDFSPSVSPDGAHVAFLRQFNVTGTGYIYILMMINADGTNLQSLTDTEGLVGANTFGSVSDTAWANDGRISFTTHNAPTGNNAGIYTRDPSGGLVQTVVDPSASGLSWSPIDKELVYGCSFRKNDLGGDKLDLCIWDDAKKQGRQLPIDYDGALPTRSNAFSPKWTSDGERILFSMNYVKAENGHNVSRQDIFVVSAAGGGLTKLTDSGSDLCPDAPDGVGAYVWEFASPSPDGGSFAVDRLPIHGWNGTSCDGSGGGEEVYVMPLGGGAGSLLVGPGADVTVSYGTDWQPIPTSLIVNVDDGHEHPLKGLKLELKSQLLGTLLGTNTAGGTYVFDGVPEGQYTLRATLIDNEGAPSATPSFDIRHNAEATTPVWIETPVNVKEVGKSVATQLHFADADTITATSVQDTANRVRLSDMAAIYWRVRQYVDWVKANITPNTDETVEYYTFAEVDAYCDGDVNDGNACVTDADCPSGTCTYAPVPPTGAYYNHFGTYIVIGTELSKYTSRDGTATKSSSGSTAPENAEWHEFTHHLYRTYVYADSCEEKNHGGYNNFDTCDSLNEGFSAFLPAFAAHDIDGTSGSFYDGIADLDGQVKAWDTRVTSQGVASTEDLAVAALFWDLTDAGVDVELNAVYGEDGATHPVVYVDSQQMSVADLWNTMVSAGPRTVQELRAALGSPPLTEDFDGDGIPDAAPLDDVFLMHGFYPVAAQQLITPNSQYHYDVAAAQRQFPALPRDHDVGYSNHYALNVGGGIVQIFSPRQNTPVSEGANVGFNVVDASGRPLSGATVDLTISRPGQPDTTKTVRLGTGDDALVHLELPPYFDYLPPVDAPIPPCDPSTDATVQVTARTTVNGYVSSDVASFDNCTYWQAIAAATGDEALTFTSTFPDDSTPPVSTIISSPSDTLIGDATVGVWIVRFTCADPADTGFAAGCDHTEYVLDGGPLTTYQDRVIVDALGQHTVQYRSVDAAGNQEVFQSVELDVAPIPGPTITSFSPTTGIFGTNVTITGTNLDRTTGVSFNGVPTTFSWLSWATELNAVVPVGATTGAITVTTPGGTASTTTDMTVIQPPTITSFTPTSGVVGTLITVKGTNFDTANNAFIGGNNAGWRVDSSTQVTLLVIAGDTTGPIQIQTQAGTATSATNFVVAASTTTSTSTSTTSTLKGHKTTTTSTTIQPPTSTTTATSSTTTTTTKSHKTTTSTTQPASTTSSTTTTLPGTCGSSGSVCSHNSDCCSGTCSGKTKTCK